MADLQTSTVVAVSYNSCQPQEPGILQRLQPYHQGKRFLGMTLLVGIVRHIEVPEVLVWLQQGTLPSCY